MKKLTSLFLACALMLSLAFAGCASVTDMVDESNSDTVVIAVTGEVAEGTTLLDYMQSINGGEILKSYVIENGMVTCINGMKASGNTYWMLFTDDVENSNSDWGSVTVEGITYNSASLGAESLVVKSGCTYIWQLQSF